MLVDVPLSWMYRGSHMKTLFISEIPVKNRLPLVALPDKQRYLIPYCYRLPRQFSQKNGVMKNDSLASFLS